jgi:hypothetical protein|tara:strand:+ start:29 stop:1378 length:1350 start_codon:yes stop_codon:yes gene_type:complete
MSVTDTIVKATVYDIPTVTKLVELVPEGQGILFPEVISFNYYESVFEDFITAELTILDSAGLVDESFDKCGVRQFCPVEIEFPDPSKGTEWEKDRPNFAFTGKNCFFVNNVSDQIIQGKKKQYKLQLVNRDAVVALSKNVKSSWPPDDSTKVDYNTVVDSLLTKYIQTAKNKEPVMKYMTESIAKLQGHNFKVYELLNAMCQYATPKGTDGSGQEETRPAGYAFYETYDEYRFDPIHKLMTEAYRLKSAYKVMPVNDDLTGPAQASQTILSYKFYDGVTQSSLLEEIAAKKRGKPKTKVLDVQRNTFTDIEKLPPKTIEDKCLKAPSDGDFTTVKYLEQTQYQMEYYNTCDEKKLDNEPTNPELTSLNYGAMLDLLRTKVSTIRVPGNLSLSAGDHLELDFPLIKGDSGKAAEASDKYSGKYLITRVNHRVEDITHLYTHMEICKLVES